MNKILKPFFIIIFCFMPLASHGDFGESCTPLPISGATKTLLLQNNTFGYVTSVIDMEKYIPSNLSCEDGASTITICLLSASSSPGNPACDLVTFNIGDVKKLFNVSISPGQDPDHPLKEIEFEATTYKGNICIFMPTSYGKMPIACKFHDSGYSSEQDNITDIKQCTISGSCYGDIDYSRSVFNFSGRAVHCVKETLENTFYSATACVGENEHSNIQSNISPFYYIQTALKTGVIAAVIIYIIFVGMLIILEPEKQDLEQIVTAALKIIFVIYFSIGFGNVEYQGGGYKSNDGMTEVVLPILLQFMNDFALIIFESGGNQTICHFDPSEYPSGYSFYSLWDSIDCRIAHYFGGNFFAFNAGGLVEQAGDIFSGSMIFPIFSFMALILFGGNIPLFLFTLIFVVMFLSVLLFFISSYIVCLIIVFVMAYLAPLFVPMVLFSRTRGYFDSWAKIILSCTLQPFILAAFISILLSFYDTVVYGNCNFTKQEVEGKNIYYLSLPNIDVNECEKTIGYKLKAIFTTQKNITTDNALIFSYTRYDDYDYLLEEMLYLSVFAVIFYFFSKIIGQFASDITGGVAASAVVIDPTLFANKFKKYLSKGTNAAKAAGKHMPSGKKSSSASDKVSTGEAPETEGADDKFTTDVEKK